MARTSTGIDVGHSTAIAIKGQFKGGTFKVSGFAAEAVTPGKTDAAWKSLGSEFKLGGACIGLTGRDMNMRYVRVPRVPDWQLRKLMRFEVEDVGGQSGQEVASDFNLLPEFPEIDGEDVVVLAMAKESMLEEQGEGLALAGGKLESFAPNALALYNAWLRFGVIEGDTVMVANIGAENTDVIICRGPDLIFARNLSGGSKLFDEAIAQRFDVSLGKAEEVKIEYATLEPGARYENSNQEKASRAIAAAAGQLQSLLQSTVLFCKSQLKIQGLKIDRVALCGGGAALDGLPAWLSSTMGVPVELFDAFRMVEISGLSPEAADRLEEYKLESVTALGLATMASDPESFSVEILPSSMRKRREFWGGTAFLAGAGLLALGFLAWNAMDMSAQLTGLESDVSKLQRDLKRAQSTHNQTSELLVENARLEAETLDYQGLLGAGEQLARSLNVINKHMPEEYWLSRLESRWGFDPGLGIDRSQERPIIHLEGRARQGTNQMSLLHEAFVASLRSELPGVNLWSAPKYDGSSFALDLTTLALPEAITEDSEEGGDL
jgi:Tfp pilus assembly PilM family ATPase